jgi:hypothetical protein
MDTELVFDDLFPFGGGFCYLRVYRNEAGRIALAVQVKDAPGTSIVNGAEALTKRIETAFRGKLRLLLHFPCKPGDDPVWSEVSIDSEGRARFDRQRIPHEEVEEFVGMGVPLPKADAAGAAEIGGAFHTLLRLIPPKEEERTLIDEMQVVAVADLPWAHNPYECAHADRFEATRKLYGEALDTEGPTGAHFFLSLDEDAFASCRYHQYDWRAIAAASIELFETLDSKSQHSEIVDRASVLLANEADRGLLVSLFSDPIKWSPGATAITNGQHRICALKAAGAALCVARTHGELRTEPVAADPYRRAQSTLAEYWARQLGRDHPLSSNREPPD